MSSVSICVCMSRFKWTCARVCVSFCIWGRRVLEYEEGEGGRQPPTEIFDVSFVAEGREENNDSK